MRGKSERGSGWCRLLGAKAAAKVLGGAASAGSRGL